MEYARNVKALLIIAALMAIGIGSALTGFPIAFNDASGVDVAHDASTLNEIRAAGGSLLFAGLVIGAGAFSTRMTFTSLVVAASVYLGYGFGRTVSFLADGRASGSLVTAFVVEIVGGGICLAALLRFPAERGARVAGDARVLSRS